MSAAPGSDKPMEEGKGPMDAEGQGIEAAAAAPMEAEGTGVEAGGTGVEAPSPEKDAATTTMPIPEANASKPGAGNSGKPAQANQGRNGASRAGSGGKGTQQQDAGSKPAPGAFHTVALVQPSKHDSTRFYQDFSTMADAVDGVLKMFETRLKEYNPGASSISYDYNSVCQYLDDMREVCLLSWDPAIQGYKRYDRTWIKSALQDHLSNLAAPTYTQTRR